MEGKEVDSVNEELEYFKAELAKTHSSTFNIAFEKMILAALGSIPWVGGFVSAAASIKTEEGDRERERLQNKWLEEHSNKLQKLLQTLAEIYRRLESIGEHIDERIQDPQYLDIVRKAFRVWDEADTDEKRKYISNLIQNAAGTRVCSDDVIRLFIDWLRNFHESHFAVIAEIFRNPGVTRYGIWINLYTELVPDNSAEADLYKFLLHQLSTGYVIRQARETTIDGQFLKKQPIRNKGKTSTMETPFEDSKQYVLTELGKQFVHYSMTELVPRVASATNI
jgi:hypothetical protein